MRVGVLFLNPVVEKSQAIDAEFAEKRGEAAIVGLDVFAPLSDLRGSNIGLARVRPLFRWGCVEKHLKSDCVSRGAAQCCNRRQGEYFTICRRATFMEPFAICTVQQRDRKGRVFAIKGAFYCAIVFEKQLIKSLIHPPK